MERSGATCRTPVGNCRLFPHVSFYFLLLGLCMSGICWPAGRVEEADVILQRSEGGVDSALLYAKTVSKYMKDLMSYVEKRTSLGECLHTTLSFTLL